MARELGSAPLDEHERNALRQFIRLVTEEATEVRLVVEEGHEFRSADGQIIVPVRLAAREPVLGLALLMEHKAEHLYKQTGCRFVLAQRPEQEAGRKLYVWSKGSWAAL